MRGEKLEMRRQSLWLRIPDSIRYVSNGEGVVDRKNFPIYQCVCKSNGEYFYNGLWKIFRKKYHILSFLPFDTSVE